MKAIIMSHERGGSYVLDREGCFHFVKGHTAQPIGAEVELKPLMLLHLRRAAAIAACLVVTAVLGCLGWLWNTESYSVYVDINPSVELVFNNLNRLKAARPLNEDGAALLKGLTLRGPPADVVVDLLEAAKLEARVTRSDTKGKVPVAVITVLAREGKAPEQYEAIILAALNKYGLNGLADIIVCDQDIRDRAAGLGISPGKLKLAERLFALDQSTPVDELTKLSVVDLMAKIGQEQLDGNSAPEAQEKPEIFGTNSGNNAMSSTPADIAVDNGGSSTPQVYADAGSGNGDAAKTDNIGTGADNGSDRSSSKADNPGTGSGNGGSSSKPDDSGTGSGNGGSSSKPDDSDTGSGDGGSSSESNDSGTGPGDGGSSSEPDNPAPGSDDNDSSSKADNPNKGPGNNSGNNSGEDNPNKGPGNNSGNNSGEDNPNKGPGNDNGKE